MLAGAGRQGSKPRRGSGKDGSGWLEPKQTQAGDLPPGGKHEGHKRPLVIPGCQWESETVKSHWVSPERSTTQADAPDIPGGPQNFPGGSDDKESACSAGDPGLISGRGIFPWRREWLTHSSILAWRIPWTEEPGRLQPMGLQRVGGD